MFKKRISNKPLLAKIGDTFGYWTIIKQVADGKNYRKQWLCRCACGTEKIVAQGHLRNGATRSCGCFRLKHGLTESLTYSSWGAMKSRCLRKSHHAYHNYGGRGITISERWEKSFVNFLTDMGERPSKNHSLERKDSNGNYEPSNCRWATPKEQQRNVRNNHLITFEGETKCLAEWCEIYQISHYTASRRMASGWSIEQALTRPVRILPKTSERKSSRPKI